jgi:hypothetical protein
MHAIGDVPIVMKELLRSGLLRLGCLRPGTVVPSCKVYTADRREGCASADSSQASPY